MKFLALVALLLGPSSAIAAEFLVGVGKDETTGYAVVPTRTSQVTNSLNS